MAERSVVVRLKAEIGAYKAAMGEAARSATAVATAATTASTKTAKGLADQRKAADNARSSWEGLGLQATVAGGALVAGFGLATKASMDFDKQLSAVKAVTGATAAEMGTLRAAALQAGKDTVFSASEAAQAQGELGRAGVSTADILSGALRGSMDLAAAGGIGLADAATIAAQSMNTFGLAGADVPHIADLLAASANKSAATVEGMGAALRQSGLVANQLGLTIEDTTGILSAFADKGLEGSDAGTSLKTMLQRLTPQSAEAAAKMQELGVTAFDSQGKFIGLEEWAGRLQAGMADLSVEERNAAMAVMFGSDAVRAANVVYGLGTSGVGKYVSSVNDAGAAARTAAEMTDNLAGDMEQLSGSIETTMIKAGSGANSTLRFFTQAASNAVDAVGALPGPLQSAVLGIGGIAGVALLAAPRIAATREALQQLNLVSTQTGKMNWSAIGKGLAGGAVAAGVALIGTAALASHQEVGQLVEGLEAVDTALAKGGDEWGAAFASMNKQLAEAKLRLKDATELDNVGDFLSDFGGNVVGGFQLLTGQVTDVDRLTESIKKQEGEAKRLTAAQTQLALTWMEATERSIKPGNTEMSRARELMSQAAAAGVNMSGSAAEVKERVLDWARANVEAAGAAGTAKAAVSAFGDETLTAADRTKALTAALDQSIGLLLGISNAEIGAAAAIDSLSEGLKKNGNTFDLNTKAGRENMSNFNQLISNASNYATKLSEQGKSQEEVSAGYHSMVEGQIESARLSGEITDKQARKLLDLAKQYDQFPTDVTTNLTADAASLEGEVAKAQATLDSVKQKHPAYIEALNKAEAAAAAAHANVNRVRQERPTDIKAINKAEREAAEADAAVNRVKQDHPAAVKAVNKAEAAVNAAQAKIDSVHGKTVTIDVQFKQAATGLSHLISGIKRASGGPVSGPGTETSDSIPAWLSDGEYVINAKQARKHRPLLDAINSGAPGFAKGGPVSSKGVDPVIAQAQSALRRAKSGGNKKAIAAAEKELESAKSAVEAWNSARDQIRDSLSQGAIPVLTMDGYKRAQEDTASAVKSLSDALRGQADAENAVFEARRKLAGSRLGDRPEALRALTEAEQRYADAKASTAAAQDAAAKAAAAEAKAKPTAANVVAEYSAYRVKVQQYGADLNALKARGLSGPVLADIAKRGFDEGSALARALVETGTGAELAALNAEFAAIQAAGTVVGEFAAGPKPAPKPKAKPKKKAKKRAAGGPVISGETYVVGEEGPETFVPGLSGMILPNASTINQAVPAYGTSATVTAPIQISLDGHGVWQGLLRMKNDRGLVTLGLERS